MIETSPIAWLVFFVLFALASLAGTAISSILPWSELARKDRVDFASGLALGPFLAGAFAIVSLGLFPGVSHIGHISMALGALAVLAAGIPVMARVRSARGIRRTSDSNWLTFILVSLLVLWVFMLLMNTIMLPLTQNDSLEYATVGRILYETRDLAAYPVLHPEATTSGFFGPWTHPPLYVAMIYLANAIQGDATDPGLMRLIAPWCAIVATILVYAMASRISRLSGLLAAIIFISTPLFYLGADSALIDALPVLGFTLILAVIANMDGSGLRRGLIEGAVLGFALWTHSQAVLFIPLSMAAVLLYRGWSDWRELLREWAGLLIVALMLAGWPYARNVLLFGSPISDNPAVFALPTLGWPEYFRFTRGVDNWPAVIQYGLLKGWFALEAYGLSFWLMSVGVATYLWRFKGDIGRANLTGRVPAKQYPMIWMLLGLIACYLLGVIVSVVLGLDLMIKNERYMLIILPAVAIVGAYAFCKPSDHGGTPDDGSRAFSNGEKPHIHTAAVVVLILISGAQLLVLSKFRLAANNLPLSKLGRDFEETLENRPEYQVVRHLRLTSPPDALVLSLKPADMYYAQRKMVSYLDPRLIPFYREVNPEEGLRRLHELGITYVHVPDYSLPPLYNSVLQEILRSPSMSTLEFSADGNQIYALHPDSIREGTPVDVTPGSTTWKRSTSLLIGGRKALAGVTTSTEPMEHNETSRGGLPVALFHRDWSTSLTSHRLPVIGGQEYGIDLNLEGQGTVHIWLRQENGAGPIRDVYPRSHSRILIGDLVLSPDHARRKFAKRVRLLSATRYLSIEVEHVGTSSLYIKQALITPLERAIHK